MYEPLLDVLRASIDARAPAAIRDWFDKLLGIRERGMRAQALADRLQGTDSHFALALLCELIDLAAERDPRARELLLDLTSTRPLGETVGYDGTRRVYELAHRQGRADVARLFLSPEALNPRTPSDQFLARENQRLPDESLGWRKRLARGTDRQKLDRLLFDRNPTVIRLLLANPRIIERDVVRIAAMRPTNPDNLVAVFQSKRWISRYRVKVALACNPWSPIDVALACVPHLMTQDLRYVATNEKIEAAVREAGQELLRRSGQENDPGEG